MVTGRAFKKLNDNDYIFWSCGCGTTGAADPTVGADNDRYPARGRGAECRVQRSGWCRDCGSAFCQAILDGFTGRHEVPHPAARASWACLTEVERLLILERFQGPDGKRLLVEAISAQTLVQGSEAIAQHFAEAAELIRSEPGEVIIEQHDATNDLFLILSGSFSITVNGRHVAQRQTRQSVGEMSLVDPASRRSATVIALEESVVARIPEPMFAKIAGEHSELWRRIAAALADRLRQRNQLVRARNETPRVFIGSSTESLAIANAIQAGFSRDPFRADVWTNGVFGPSEFAIESLERETGEKDFAVLVLGPDDKVNSRDVEQQAPRDNVILELGLFIGALGHSRVFMVLPRGADIKIPTDLLGVTPVRYSPAEPRLLSRRMQGVCAQLRKVFTEQGPR